jgi:hypothetical protein
MSEETPVTKAHDVLETASTFTPPSVLSQDAIHQEQLLKFFIGLRLLGKKRRERYLEYMLTLQEKSHPDGE